MFDTRYKFTAKELDNETSYTYFGARYYDSELSGWLSVDPMSDKYPSLSPYIYCYNNPVIMKDPNGNDGVAVVNNENKTITIKAVYYVQTVPSFPSSEHTSYTTEQLQSIQNTAYTPEEVKSMQTEINDFLNNQNYQVTEGEYSGYKVNFDLQFKEGGESLTLEEKAKNEFYGGIPIGNCFKRGDKNSFPLFKTRYNKETGNYETIGGVTQDKNLIVMNEKYDDLRNRIHEVFHTLFFNRDRANDGIGSYSTNDMPNQNDINVLINNENLPKININE